MFCTLFYLNVPKVLLKCQHKKLCFVRIWSSEYRVCVKDCWQYLVKIQNDFLCCSIKNKNVRKRWITDQTIERWAQVKSCRTLSRFFRHMRKTIFGIMTLLEMLILESFSYWYGRLNKNIFSLCLSCSHCLNYWY